MCSEKPVHIRGIAIFYILLTGELINACKLLLTYQSTSRITMDKYSLSKSSDKVQITGCRKIPASGYSKNISSLDLHEMRYTAAF